jgi:hypothetical protein
MTGLGKAKIAAVAAVAAVSMAVQSVPAQGLGLTLAPAGPQLQKTATVAVTPPALSPSRQPSPTVSLSIGPAPGTHQAGAPVSPPPASVQLAASATPAPSHTGGGSATPAKASPAAVRTASPTGPSGRAVASPSSSAAQPAGQGSGGQTSGASLRGPLTTNEEVLAESAARRGAGAHLTVAPGLGAAAAHAAHQPAAAATGSAFKQTAAAPLALTRHAPLHVSGGGGRDLPALELPPGAGEALEVVLIVIGAMLLTVLLFADQLQLGERYRDLRARLSQRRLG